MEQALSAVTDPVASPQVRAHATRHDLSEASHMLGRSPVPDRTGRTGSVRRTCEAPHQPTAPGALLAGSFFVTATAAG